MKETQKATLAELENYYREQSRMHAQATFNNPTNHEFLNATRENLETVEKEKNVSPVHMAYASFVEDESNRQQELYQKYQAIRDFEMFLLYLERKYNPNQSSEYTRKHSDRIEEMNQALDKQMTSYECYFNVYRKQWINDKKTQSRQGLVETQYVKANKQKIIESLNKGIPVYIVGHLGSGKTQLAIEAAVDFKIQTDIYKHLEIECENWYQIHNNASYEEIRDFFTDRHHYWKDYYDNLVTHSEEGYEKLQPLFISGSHNLSYEDMFVEKTLQLKQSVSDHSFEEYLDHMVGDYREWLEHHSQTLEALLPEEQLQMKVQVWKSFSDLLVAKSNAYGTVVEKIERDILIALREGRPVIVDELNTIAMQNLIGLNDLLQRHAGQTAYVTGVGAVKIEHGFAFIGTGNLSTGNVQYSGTNKLNPAFQSRFMTVEYQYIPQSFEGNSADVMSNQKQLFRVVLSMLANEQGHLQIPGGNQCMDELYRLCQFASLSQHVFMGKMTTQEDQSVSLHEAVLSIRNMKHVLDAWNYGESQSLSMALWEGFLSSITHANDQHYLLSQAHHFGFFMPIEGWSFDENHFGNTTVNLLDLIDGDYRYVRQAQKTYCCDDLIELIFGKAPKPHHFPCDIKGISLDETQQFTMEDLLYINETLQKLDYTRFLIEYVKEGGDAS